jgi:hypothetical protein
MMYRLTTLLTTFVLLLSTSFLFAQAPPQGINYQAVARDGSDSLLANTSVTVRASIHKTNATGTVVWEEEHNVTTNQFGLINVQIGQGNKTGGSLTNFSDIDWKSDEYYLQIELDDGSGFTDMGTSQLVSVPYAMMADKALVADSAVTAGGSGGSGTVSTTARIAGDGSSTSPLDIAQQSATSGQALKWNGSNWVPQDDAMTTDTSHWEKIGSQLYYRSGHVNLNTSSSSFFNVDNNGNNAGYRVYDGGSFQGGFFYDPTPGITFLSQSFSNKTLSFDGDDQVGVGTATPGEDLHVLDSDGSGNSIIQVGSGTGDGVEFGSAEYVKDGGSNTIEAFGRIIPDSDGNRDLGSSGSRWQDVWATNGTIQTSDERDKEDIKPLNYGLQEVMSLKPVQFEWKDREEGRDYVGLVAQDVQDVVPEVVKSTNIKHMEDGTKKKVGTERLGLYYSHLVPVLVNAVKEQQNQIQQKEEKIQEQEEEIEKLKSEMEQIRSRLDDLEE